MNEKLCCLVNTHWKCDRCSFKLCFICFVTLEYVQANLSEIDIDVLEGKIKCPSCLRLG